MQFPAQMVASFATAMGTGAQKKNAQRIMRLVGKLESIHTFFRHFLENEWVFDTTNLERLINKLSPQEAETFVFDVTKICWDRYTQV